MMRIDLVVNNLLASAMAYERSGSSPRLALAAPDPLPRHRPGVRRFASAPREAIHDQAINVGGNAESYRCATSATRSSG